MTMLISRLSRFAGAALMVAMFTLSGCGGGGGAQGTSTTTTAAKILLSLSQASVHSDNSDSTVITATVVDVNNVPVAGGTIHFSSSAGSTDSLGVNSGAADAAGAVTIPFKAGSNKANRTETITATLVKSSISAQIPIQVIGSTLTVTPSVTSLQSGNPMTLTATAKDYTATGVASQSIRFSIPSGNGVLSGGTVGTGTSLVQTVATNSTGTTSSVTFTPSNAGSVVVTADWLDANGNTSMSTTTTITVTAAGVAFAVTSPTTNPASLYLTKSSPVNVSVPTQIAGTTVTNVRFSTSLGTWPNSSKSYTTAPSANSASAILTAGSQSGIANVQIDALGAAPDVYTAQPVLATLTWNFAISAPYTAAATITLQPSTSNVEISIGGTTHSATLTATVRDGSGGNTVANVPVLFEIMNPTGSGEQVSPVVATTNSSGVAQSTFTSGSQTTVGGLKIKASVLGTSSACDNSVVPAIAGICDVKTIYVNGSGVSLSIGTSSLILDANNSTNYDLPMSILVVSNTGEAVANTVVTLSAFPAYYYVGTRGVQCAPIYSGGPYGNEDSAYGGNTGNENDNLDAGEDKNGDGVITPPHASAGTVPSTVTTDANGVALFHLIYQKDYANWIATRIRAKVVIGAGTTESTSEKIFILPMSAADAKDPCPLGGSPSTLTPPLP